MEEGSAEDFNSAVVTGQLSFLLAAAVRRSVEPNRSCKGLV